MRNRAGVGGFSSWLAAVGMVCVLAPGAVAAADGPRSAPETRSAATLPAPEAVPLLLTDPATGATMRIWSRSDGFSTKIAWSRDDGAGWSASHDLTFGLGVDRDPAVAVTSAGAWLFWRDDRGGVFYAPLEIGSGRLLGVAAPLAPAPSTGLPGPRLEGGNDVPVVLGNCDPTDAGCILRRSQPPTIPGQTNPTYPVMGEGGNDVPVTIGTGSSSSATLVTASDPTCESTIVSVAQGGTVLVSELDAAGRVRTQHTVRIGAGIKTEDAAAGVSQFYIDQTCGH